MDSNLFVLGGYGQFIWPAFIFTFFACLTLYLKTKAELKKQEKLFLNEYKHLEIIKIEISEKEKSINAAYSSNTI